MAPEKRGTVNCDKSFGVKQKKFGLAVKVLQYFEASLNVDHADIVDAQGNVSFLMEQELQYCHLWNATTEAEYPTDQYRADMDKVRAWFNQMIEALKIIASNSKPKESVDTAGEKKPNGISTVAPVGKENPKSVAKDLLQALSDAIKPSSTALTTQKQATAKTAAKSAIASDKQAIGLQTFANLTAKAELHHSPSTYAAELQGSLAVETDPILT